MSVLSSTSPLTGIVSTSTSLRGTLAKDAYDSAPHLIGKLSTSNSLHGSLAKNVYDPVPYTGEYEVVSKIDYDETLDTAKKYLSRNIIVKSIPYAEVSNESGGRTVTIGG